jgi:hypothetical protein
MAVRSEYKVMSEKPLLRVPCLQSLRCVFRRGLLNDNSSSCIINVFSRWLAEVVTIAAVGR